MLPPPTGYSPQFMHAAALCIFTIGLWALGAVPEHIVGLLLFLLAMVFAVAPANVVFSGFASGTLWLVLGGLIIGEAVNSTGLGERFARFLIGRRVRFLSLAHRAGRRGLHPAVPVMPATVSRILLLMPIMSALAQRVGLEPGVWDTMVLRSP